MKRLINMAVSVTICVFCTFFAAHADGIPPEKYEHITTSKITPWITNYHLATPEHLEDNIKGGEGYQIPYAAAISDADANIMIRGYDTSGVYWSEDGGKTWLPALSGCPSNILSLAFYPGSKNVCFAQAYGTEHMAGIYKSEDGGKTWRRTFTLAHRYTILKNDIVFGKKDEKTGVYPIYCAVSLPDENVLGDKTKCGVFRSKDEGETFESVGGLEDYQISNIAANQDTGMVIAVANAEMGADGKETPVKGGVYISENNGESFSLCNEDVEDLVLQSVSINPADPKKCILSTADHDEKNQNWLFESTNGGKSWTKIENVIWQKEGQPKISTHGNTLVAHFLYMPPDKDGKCALLAMMNETVYPNRISYDDGRTWEVIDVDQRYQSDKTSTGWFATRAAVTKADSNLILWDVNISHDRGKSFHWAASGISGALSNSYVFDENGRIRFVGMTDMGIEEALDGYEGDFPPLSLIEGYPSGGGGKTVMKIIGDPKDRNHFFSMTGESVYGKESTIVETDDGFKTFKLYVGMAKRLQQMTKDAGEIRNIIDLWYAPTDSNVIYSSWFVSSDNGKTWRESTREIKAVSPFDADVAYAVDQDEIFITKNRAKTWKSTGIKLGSRIERCITPDLYEDYVLWVGRHSDYTTEMYRIDLKTGRIKTMNSSNGLKQDIESDFGLQIEGLAQSPLDKNLLICTGRDFYNARYFKFITVDGGEHWHLIEGMPACAGGSSNQFHPTKPYVYMGTMQGLMVLDYEKYIEYHKEDFK